MTALRDRLVADWQTLARLWSVQWAALGAVLLPILNVVPSMPWEIQQLLPPRVRVVLTSVWCVLFIALRWTQQRQRVAVVGSKRMAVQQPKGTPTGPLAALILLLGSGLAATVMGDTRQDEGVSYQAYPDLGGVFTICSGSTSNVKPGEVDTAEQCDARTAADLLGAAKTVLFCAPDLKAPERHQQLRSVIRFQNNTHRFCSSTGAWLMKAGQWKAGCDSLQSYNGIITPRPMTGKSVVSVRRLKDGRYFNVIRGLVNRRAAEHSICTKGLS